MSQVYAGPGRAKRFMVFPVSKHSIVGMLMGYGAMMDFLGSHCIRKDSDRVLSSVLFQSLYRFYCR